MVWRKDNEKDGNEDSGKSLSFAGNGKVSVSIESIVKSHRVREQVKAVRELAAASAAAQGSTKK